MHTHRAALPRLVLAAALGLAFFLTSVAAGATTVAAEPDEHLRAAHALKRLGYGPRPGQVAELAALGVDNWMRRQLEPATIADPVAEAAVAALPKLALPKSELVRAYHQELRDRNQLQRAQAAGDFAEAGRLRVAMEEREQAVVAQAIGELQHARLVRAVLSERQLEQVLVDFWFNHFNVDVRKRLVRATVIAHEQEAIRPHVFGNFRDLLGATAKSPAMLVYLDNALSVAEREATPAERARVERLRSELAGDEAPAPAAPSRRGLNENYGRELLELHTLGVDAGYTQKDVQEVARVFTGWTIEPRSGDFVFRRRWHDSGPKTILGVSFPGGGGQREGEQVLDLLAAHPATARRIATKLCQRFVADEPPPALVERVAEAYLAAKGDLRRTYEALFFAPEFFAPEHFGAKTKSPFEFTASALRAAGADLVAVEGLRGRAPLRAVEAGAAMGRGGERLAGLPRKTVMLHIVEMGQPIYAWGPPTGFPEDSSSWVSAGALVSRLNFALAMTAGQVADARVDPRRLVAGVNADRPDEVVSALGRSVLGAEPGANTRRVLLAQAAPSEGGATAVPEVPKLLALLLGSPEFQRR